MKFHPRCVHQGKNNEYLSTGHIIPCCMLHDFSAFDTHWVQNMLTEELKVENVESIEEIHNSKAWKDFEYMLINNPEEAPKRCKDYCSWKDEEVQVLKIGQSSNRTSPGGEIYYYKPKSE